LSTSQRLTGAHLRSFVFQEQNKIPAIAENFIYQKSIIMISGDPGVGKSTINANIIRDLSEGVPVFNFFYVPKPVLVYYIPFERGNYEVADRLRALSSVIEPNWHNIIITTSVGTYLMANKPKPSLMKWSQTLKNICPLGWKS